MSLAELRPDWSSRAACAGVDQAVFYPEQLSSVKQAMAVATARIICRGCEVRAECLAFALETAEHHGIWGGHTVDERIELAGGKLVAATPPNSSTGRSPVSGCITGSARSHVVTACGPTPATRSTSVRLALASAG